MFFNLTTTLTKSDILKLKVGDKVLLSGTVFTARDRAHKFFLKHNFKKIKNVLIYHCGPIVKNNEVVAAGPTTSGRMNFYASKLIKKYNIRAIIGKGGMDDEVLKAMNDSAVYFAAIGGAAVIYAKTMKIKNVYKLEFGMAEAIWEFGIKNFPAIVAMDARGNSLYDQIFQKSKRAVELVYKL